jgi:hypothetical protein
MEERDTRSNRYHPGTCTAISQRYGGYLGPQKFDEKNHQWHLAKNKNWGKWSCCRGAANSNPCALRPPKPTFGLTLYAKWLRLSLKPFFPKISMPYHLLPFLSKSKTYEYLVGGYSLKLNIQDDIIGNAQMKSVKSPDGYLDLLDFLASSNEVSASTINSLTTSAVNSPVTNLSTEAMTDMAMSEILDILYKL